MKYWIDTEFIERPYTIDLISVGLVAEDGRSSTPRAARSTGRRPASGPCRPCGRNSTARACRGKKSATPFAGSPMTTQQPVFWGYFPAYDWVVFSWLFGDMNELPFHFPQLCLDIKQWAIELGDPELPRQVGARHHALADARWTREAWAFLASLHPAGAERRCAGSKYPDRLTAKPA